MLEGYKTVIGLVISAVGQLMATHGIAGDAVNSFLGVANDTVTTVMSFGGLVLALYGRWKATTPMLTRKPKI